MEQMEEDERQRLEHEYENTRVFCKRCGTELKDIESKIRGYGHLCYILECEQGGGQQGGGNTEENQQPNEEPQQMDTPTEGNSGKGERKPEQQENVSEEQAGKPADESDTEKSVFMDGEIRI